MLYFIQDESGPIKIGVAKDVPARLAIMQVNNPRELTLLGSFDVSPGAERELHLRLARHRVRGEWFEGHADVYAAFDALVDSAGVTACPECERIERFLERGLDPGRPASRHTCGRKARFTPAYTGVSW